MATSRVAGQSRSGTLFLLLLVTGALLIGMHLGRRVAEQDAEIPAVAARPGAGALEATLREVRAELQMSMTRHEVDRQTLQMVRAEIAAQKEEIAALEEDLRFYRGLMAPESTSAVISLVPPEISRGGAAGQYGYRIVVLQRARKHAWAKGHIEIAVVGSGADGPVSYALAELSEAVPGPNVELGFRYFQVIEGDLALPEGFQPLAIEVAASLLQPEQLELRERYPWPSQE